MPAQAGIQAFPLQQSAFFLDSRFRGNDVSFFLSKKPALERGRLLPSDNSYTDHAAGSSRFLNCLEDLPVAVPARDRNSVVALASFQETP